VKEHGPIVRNELEYTGLTPGFIKPAHIAWYASHYHTDDGTNQPYKYCYLFATSVDLPEGATTLTLPDNDKIRIMAVTVADKTGRLHPAQPLYDAMGNGK
jgi:alpha-mannosidase